MNIQDLFDGMSMRMQKLRAEKQMTLGKLIAVLEEMPPDVQVQALCCPHSYRGYYEDLAFTRSLGSWMSASTLLSMCKEIMGAVLEGYKGGDFVMGALTPVWLACYGETGDRLLELKEDGTLVYGSEDYAT